MKIMKLFGKTYKIDFDTEKIMDRCDIGTVNKNEGLILVEQKMSKDEISETILHEFIHCIDSDLKIGLSEEQVCRISVGLFSFFSENNFPITNFLECE